MPIKDLSLPLLNLNIHQVRKNVEEAVVAIKEVVARKYVDGISSNLHMDKDTNYPDLTNEVNADSIGRPAG